MAEIPPTGAKGLHGEVPEAKFAKPKDALTKNIPEAAEGLKRMPNIQPPTLATTPAPLPRSNEPKSTRPAKETIPDKVTHAEMKRASKSYGGW